MRVVGRCQPFKTPCVRTGIFFFCYVLRKRYGHGGRVHEIKITDTAEITIAGTNPNPEP